MWNLTGWATKGRCEISLVDIGILFVELSVLVLVVVAVSAGIEKLRSK